MPPSTLKETTMSPDSRNLQRIEIPDGEVLATESVISAMMGKDPSARYDMLISSMDRLQGIDL
jgi:DNA gyrase subunit B/topoisomerase-4 subunit B